MLVKLETGAFSVVGNDWNARLDKFFIENLGKYRKYDGKSIQDLMRALRNKVSVVLELLESRDSLLIFACRNITTKTFLTTSSVR